MADKLPKIFLNIDFYQKGRNLRWVKENGFEAIAILQCIWIASSQEKNCKLHTSDALALSFLQQFQDDKLINTINSAVEVGLLERDGDYLYNSQIVSDHKNFENKRRNYKKGHEKRKQNQDESTLNSNQNQNESSVDYIATEPEPEIDPEIDIEELKKKGVKLPCLFLTAEEFGGFALNYHHGNFQSALEICKAASDHRQSKGEPIPASSMAYLRNWMRRGKEFNGGKDPNGKPVPKSILETRAKYEALDNQ